MAFLGDGLHWHWTFDEEGDHTVTRVSTPTAYDDVARGLSPILNNGTASDCGSTTESKQGPQAWRMSNTAHLLRTEFDDVGCSHGQSFAVGMWASKMTGTQGIAGSWLASRRSANNTGPQREWQLFVSNSVGARIQIWSTELVDYSAVCSPNFHPEIDQYFYILAGWDADARELRVFVNDTHQGIEHLPGVDMNTNCGSRLILGVGGWGSSPDWTQAAYRLDEFSFWRGVAPTQEMAEALYNGDVGLSFAEILTTRTTEAFALRHNPRTNKVIPVLSAPTVTDIGANCVRPRVTKGY